MLDQDKNFYLIRFSALQLCWMMYEYYKEKFHVYYFWELKGEIKERFSRLI